MSIVYNYNPLVNIPSTLLNEFEEYERLDIIEKFIPENTDTNTTQPFAYIIPITQTYTGNTGNTGNNDLNIEYQIPRNGDIGTLSGIRVKNAFIDTFLSIIDVNNITLCVGGNIIKSIDIDFLNNINTIKTRYKNDLYIDLKKKNIFEKINLFELPFHVVTFNINVTVDTFTPETIELELLCDYNNIHDRSAYNSVGKMQIMKDFKSTKINNVKTKPINNKRQFIELDTSYMFNGLFITGIPIEDLNKIRIYRKIDIQQPFIEFNDDFYIHQFCDTNYENDTFYIPFSSNGVNDFINQHSFIIGNITYNCILIELITHSGNNYNVKVGFFTNIFFKMISGCGGLTRHHNLTAASISSDNLTASTSSDNSTKWKPKLRKIQDKSSLYCCVTLSKIESGDNYINCILCKRNFKDETIYWIEEKKNCPHCRSLWHDDNYIIYKNTDE